MTHGIWSGRVWADVYNKNAMYNATNTPLVILAMPYRNFSQSCPSSVFLVAHAGPTLFLL